MNPDNIPADGAIPMCVATEAPASRASAMEALRRSEARAWSLVETTRDWLWEIDTEGRYLYSSPQVLQILGYTPEQLIGRSSFELMPAAEARRMRGVLRGYVERAQPCLLEQRIMHHRDGHRVILEASATPFFDSGGRLLGYRGIDRDVTLREEREATYQSLLDYAPDAICIVSAKGYFLDANQRFLSLLGYSKDELRSLQTIDTHRPGDRDHAREIFEQVCRDGEGYWLDEVLVHRSGRLVPVDILANSVMVGGQQLIMGVIRDISARREAEQRRLADAERQRDALVREVHHRIKNNLQGVAGLLRGHAMDHPGVSGVLEAAIAQVHTVALIHGLHSRQRGGAVLLCEMVEAICNAAVGLTGARVSPRLQVQVERPLQVADREAVPVALIINELVFNAIKHGGGRCEVIVREEADGSGGVQILNDGDGLPRDFDFASGRGLGTGLNLVKALLPAQGGELVFEQDRLDVRTLLHLSRPLVCPLDHESAGPTVDMTF